MSAPSHGPAGLADSTPRDGDFVAYLAAIQRQQLRNLRIAARETAAATAATTEAHRAEQAERHERDSRASRASRVKGEVQGIVDGRRFAGAMLMAFVAIILLAAGLGDGGTWPALAIGGVLAWQAWVQGRRALAL